MYFDERIETMPREELRQLQGERLRKLARYVYERVPFYKAQWAAHNVQPDDVSSIADLPKLPFTKKADLRANYPFDLFAVPREELARIHCSSGSTGKPTVVGYTAADLAVFAEVNARSLAAAGARPHMVLHNAYGYGLFTGGLGLHAGATKLGMAVVPVSGGMTERQVMLLQDFRPEVICCTPSYAQTLAEEMKRRGISPDSLSVQYALLGAEPWTEVIRKDVERGLGLKACNIYGLSEIIGPGVSQEAVEEQGTGSYVWEDHFFPEVVDANSGEVLPEGEEGVLVITTLTKEAMPLIRYWTNDICSLYYDKHGRRTHVKMTTIKGRADDMLIVRGVNLFPTQVEAVLADFEELAPHYQLVVSRPGTMDVIEVGVEVASGFSGSREGLANTLRDRIKDTIGLSMGVHLYEPGEVPRSAGGKLKRVLDKRV